MKKYLTLMMTLTLGLILILVLVKGIGWAQEPGTDKEAPLWTSSAEIPEGMQVQSPPDKPNAIDPLDAKEANPYDSELRVAGATLKPRQSDVEWDCGTGGMVYASSGDYTTVFNVPLYLPQGATVEYLRMYYYDTNSSENCIGWFTVYDLFGSVVEEFHVYSSGDSGNNFTTTSEFSHTIDYSQYSYVLNWRPNELGSDMQLCGFRIFYEAPSTATSPIWKDYK